MRIHLSPTIACIDYLGIVLFAPYIIIQIFSGDMELYESFLSVAYFVLIPLFFYRDREYLINVGIFKNRIVSRLFFKRRCTVFCDRPVFVSFFKEFLRPVDQYESHNYVMVSNLPIPDFELNTRFETYDRSKQIIFPDTEKTRRAIAPLLDSELCILQSDAPPPIEKLRKKKEEPPVVKREKSPDAPPPFTGKWNGRF